MQSTTFSRGIIALVVIFGIYFSVTFTVESLIYMILGVLH